jgi:uncharacterized RDD family membrane protein YckC
MNRSSPFSNLDFSTRARAIAPRVLAVGAAFFLFTLLWLVVPHGILYWLLLPVVLVLTWMASYGWRPAVFWLVEYLDSLLKQ